MGVGQEDGLDESVVVEDRLDESIVVACCDKGSEFGKLGCVEGQRKEGEEDARTVLQRKCIVKRVGMQRD